MKRPEEGIQENLKYSVLKRGRLSQLHAILLSMCDRMDACLYRRKAKRDQLYIYMYV